MLTRADFSIQSAALYECFYNIIAFSVGKNASALISAFIASNFVHFVLILMPQSPVFGGKHSPEQRSFRDRQKYFEIDVKQQTPEKPKPRVSLVGEDDLKKMREEEGLFPECPS